MGLVYREVLTGRRLFVTSVEVESTVGSVWRCSRLKGVCIFVLLGVSNSRRPVLGIPKWWLVHVLPRLVRWGVCSGQCSYLCFLSRSPGLCLLSHHAVRSLVGICSSEFLTTFPTKVNCRFARWYQMVGMLNNRFQTDWFMIFLSITIVIVILSILLKFLWKNTSNLFTVASRIDQLSHPQISRLQGIAQKIKYFERLSTVL